MKAPKHPLEDLMKDMEEIKGSKNPLEGLFGGGNPFGGLGKKFDEEA
jgi:hypothetical protein